MNKTSQTHEKPAFVLWFTGLSGAGKSTLADRVYDYLAKSGRPVERLDGDSLRAAFPATGFSRKDRDEHIKRVGYMASRLEHHGVIVVASFISPYREARDFVRKLCQNFVEIFVDASLETCRQRDVKGLYKKAMAGQIQSFTGLDDPYERPLHPEITVKTDQQSIDQSEKIILDYIQRYL